MSFLTKARAVAAAATAGVLAASVAAGPAFAQEADLPAGGLPGVAVPVLNWVPCADNAAYQCAPAQVPLDYRDPGGRTITLQVRKAPATDPAKRIGTLFLHAGGPGGSGWGWVSSYATSSPAEIREKFDIVGYDARGVQRSTPTLTCLDTPTYQAQWAQVTTTPTATSFDTAVRLAREFDAACQANSAGLLPFVGAANQARDLDLMRAAVGDRKLTLFAESYATYVGTVYLNLFPKRTRAVVLDAGYDPDKYANDPYAYDHGQYLATETAMYRFLDWCAATPAQCQFAAAVPGSTTTGLAARIRAILTDLDTDPIRDAAGRIIVNGATMLSDLTFRLNAGTRRWSVLGTDLRSAESRTGPLMYVIPDSDTRFNAANVSVECADRVYPQSLQVLRAKLARAAADAPLTAPGMAYGPPAYDQTHAPTCVQWSAKRRSRYTGPYNAAGSSPVLVVGNTGDPDTPYADSVALSRVLDNGHLVTWEGEGHTARRKSLCAEGHMYAFLLDLMIPPDGTVCRDAPIPA
jgi:pimeloyl-ACP methyl ester carboxylesterase